MTMENKPDVQNRVNRVGLIQVRHTELDRVASAAHSLEHVVVLNGVTYINDSRATFLDAALRSLSEIDAPIVWISGGLPSELGQGHVHDLLRDKVVALVLFGHEGSVDIDAVQPFTQHVYFAKEVRTAAFVAHELAREGEVVLFSPGCPSGGGFANYEERGHEFKRAVKDL